jgi:sodium/potassium-transporting ATPase subunit alpha
MLLPPRNINKDRLSNFNLFFVGYAIFGVTMAAGCFLSYFGVMNDYGFGPSNLFFFANRKGVGPSINDIYNPYDIQFKGNSKGFLVDYGDLLALNGQAREALTVQPVRLLDYTSNGDTWIDLRIFYYTLPDNFWSSCALDSVGVFYDGPVCYRVEALRHAQSAYLLGNVVLQWANSLVWKTKKTSVFIHLFKNHNMNISYLVVAAMIMIVIYVEGLNTALGTRSLRIEHFSPPLLFFIIYVALSEIIKFFIRRGKSPDGSENWFRKYYWY